MLDLLIGVDVRGVKKGEVPIPYTFCNVKQVVLFAELVARCGNGSSEVVCFEQAYKECGGAYCLKHIKANSETISYLFCRKDHVVAFVNFLTKVPAFKACRENPTEACLAKVYTESTSFICSSSSF